MKFILLAMVVVSSWLSLNAYKGQEFFDNPFDGRGLFEKASDAVEDAGSDLLDRSKEMADDAMQKGADLLDEH